MVEIWGSRGLLSLRVGKFETGLNKRKRSGISHTEAGDRKLLFSYIHTYLRAS